MARALIAVALVAGLWSRARSQDDLSRASSGLSRAVRAAKERRQAAAAAGRTLPAGWYYWFMSCESVDFCPSRADQPIAWHGDLPYVPDASLYEAHPNPNAVCALAPAADALEAAPGRAWENVFLDLVRSASYASRSIAGLDGFFYAGDRQVCKFRVPVRQPTRFMSSAAKSVAPSRVLVATLSDLLERTPRSSARVRALQELGGFADAYTAMKPQLLEALRGAKDDAVIKAALATLGRRGDDEDAGAAIAAFWAPDRAPALRAAALDAHRELVSRHKDLAGLPGFEGRLVELLQYNDTHAPDPDKSSPEPANLRLAIRVYPLAVRNRVRARLGLPPDAQ